MPTKNSKSMLVQHTSMLVMLVHNQVQLLHKINEFSVITFSFIINAVLGMIKTNAEFNTAFNRIKHLA